MTSTLLTAIRPATPNRDLVSGRPSALGPAPLIISGSYVGDGTDGRTITVGFQPELVIIKPNAAAYGYFRTDSHVGDDTSYFSNAAANASDLIQSFTSTGFTVGATANANGTTYYYTAFADNGTNTIQTGTYTGNGSDNRSISGMGFRPDFVLIKQNGTNVCCFRDRHDAGDISHLVSANANESNEIQLLESDGFQLGTNAKVNSNTSTYYWFAFRSYASFIKVGRYAARGSGNDGIYINDVGFRPSFILVKKDAGTTIAYRTSAFVGDSSNNFQNNADIVGRIQGFGSKGFQAGSNSTVTDSTGDYHFLACKENTITTPQSLRPSVEPVNTRRVGMNYGSDFNYDGAPYDADQVDSDLQEIRRYFDKVRIAMPNYNANATTYTRIKNAALRAKELGFYVIVGVSSPGSSHLTSTTWSAYSTAVQDFAQWAQDNEIDEYSIGNELELKNDDSTLTDSQVRTNVRSLATTCQAIFTRGPISYSVANDQENSWISEGKGDLDLIAFNIYGTNGTRDSFSAKLVAIFNRWGNAGSYISEWNIHADWAGVLASHPSEREQAMEISERLRILHDVGFDRAYFFGSRFSAGGIATDSYATFKTNGEHHLWWNYLTNPDQRPWFHNA